MVKFHVALKDLIRSQCVFMGKSHVAVKDLVRSQCIFMGKSPQSCYIHTLNVVTFESGILGASSRDVNG